MIRYGIAAGNAFDGLTLYVGPDGDPFTTEIQARNYGEAYFDEEEWSIIPLVTAGSDECDTLNKDQQNRLLTCAVDVVHKACHDEPAFLIETLRSYLSLLPLRAQIDLIECLQPNFREVLGFDPDINC